MSCVLRKCFCPVRRCGRRSRATRAVPAMDARWRRGVVSRWQLGGGLADDEAGWQPDRLVDQRALQRLKRQASGDAALLTGGLGDRGEPNQVGHRGDRPPRSRRCRQGCARQPVGTWRSCQPPFRPTTPQPPRAGGPRKERLGGCASGVGAEGHPHLPVGVQSAAAHAEGEALAAALGGRAGGALHGRRRRRRRCAGSRC